MHKKRKAIMLAVTAAACFWSSGIKGECHSLSESSYTQIAGTMLRRGPGVTDASAVNDIQAYLKLPVSIQNMLVKNGVWIYEVDLSSDTVLIPGSCGASQSPSWRLVTRNGQTTSTVTSTGYIDIASNRVATFTDKQVPLLHEVGHQIDFFYLGGYPSTRAFYNASSQAEWLAAYAAERNIIGAYSSNASINVYSSNEAFAEAIGIYFADPEWLKTYAPLSYAYAAKVVDWF